MLELYLLLSLLSLLHCLSSGTERRRLLRCVKYFFSIPLSNESIIHLSNHFYVYLVKSHSPAAAPESSHR